MANTWLKLGSWNVICDRCGHKYKADELRKEWTGLMVCEGCWEPRHPQDYLRVPPERMDVPYVRPRGADIFVPINYKRANNDTVVMVETINRTATYIRTLPTESFYLLPLNGFVLNGFVLDGPVRMMTDGREHAYFNESLSYALTTPINDSINITESLVGYLGETITESALVGDSVSYNAFLHTSGDSAGFTETLSSITVSGTHVLNGFLLNGAALNE